MFKNYFKTASRNAVKNRFTSLINIFGLAAGITVSLLVALWIYDELSFNKYFSNYKSIARVMKQQAADGIVSSGDGVPYPLLTELQTNYRDNFKYIVLTSWMGSHVLTYGDKTISQSGMYMQQDAVKMLTLKMAKGNYDGFSKKIQTMKRQ